VGVGTVLHQGTIRAAVSSANSPLGVRLTKRVLYENVDAQR
jgi:hypothetical protein